MWKDLLYLQNETEVRELHIYFNSGGGNAFSGLSMADQLLRAQRNGFKVVAHASGIVASATIPIFAVCSERFAAESTMFMVHEASMFKFLTNESRSDLKSQTDMLDLLRSHYLEILANHTKLSADAWGAKEGKTTWFSANKALDWGLVDSIE